MRKVLLIDGDQFLFQACVVCETEIRWDDQNHVLYSNAAEARNNFDGMIERIFDRFKTKEHVLCFSAGTIFRVHIDSSYKSHRAGVRKPLCYAQLRADIESDYRCHSVDTLEADDVMGILGTKPGKAQRIIVSQDKDMRTIPGALWNGKDLDVVSAADADRFHLYQTLIGDTADGYPGCPGIGPVKAEKLLDLPDVDPKSYVKTAWRIIVGAYEKAGLTEADALRQARLARILRHTDWDAEAGQPILWTP